LVIEETDLYTSGVATTFTSTSVQETSGTWPEVQAGMRVESVVAGASHDEPTYAKITEINGDTLTVDAWSNGTPSNGEIAHVNGWVIDLPYCRKLVETFSPDVLIHELYAGDAGSKFETEFRGWKYGAVLDYSDYLSGDVMLDLGPALSQKLTDQLALIPRKDEPAFVYNVFYDGPVDMALFGRTPGYQGVVLTFRGQENVPSWPLSGGYGTLYATDYGDRL
jgi:hypothetical protein